MNIFGPESTTLSAPKGAGSSPIQPVQEAVRPASPAPFVPTGLMEIGAQFAGHQQEKAKAKAKENEANFQNSLFSEYSSEVVRIRDAFEAGNISVGEYQAKIGNLGAQYGQMAAENGFIEDFDKMRKSFFGTSMVTDPAELIKQEQEEKDRKISWLTQQNVYVPSNAPDEYLDSLMESEMKANKSIEDFELWKKRQEEIRAQNSETRASTKFGQEQEAYTQKQKAQTALNGFAVGKYDSALKSVDMIVEDFIKGGSANKDAFLAELNREKSTILGAIASLEASDPETARIWKDRFNEIYELGRKRLDSTDENLNQQWQVLINKNNLAMAAVDPRYIKIASASSVLGQSVNLTLAAEGVVQNVISLVDEAYTTNNRKNNFVGKGAEGGELGTYEEVLNLLNIAMSGGSQNPEQDKEEAFRAVNNILDLIGEKQGDRNLSSKDLSAAWSFISDPGFAKFVKAGGLNEDRAEIARSVLEQNYNKEVKLGIEAALSENIPPGSSEAMGVGGSTVNAQRYRDLIQIQYTTDGLSFQIKPGIKFTDPMQRDIVARRISNMNRGDARQGLLRLLKGSAHLEGSTDYRKFWEDNKHEVFDFYFKHPDVTEYTDENTGTVYEWVGPPDGDFKDMDNWRPKDGEGQG